MFSIFGVFLLLRLFVFHVSGESPVRNGSTFHADETKMLDYFQENSQACNDGYTGSDCTLPCRYPSYGRKCQKLCNCVEFFCNITTGCEDGSPTFSVSHPSVKTDASVQIPTAATACQNGYTGLNCNLQCIYPGFGAGCQLKCNCSVEQCDHVKGCIRNVTYNCTSDTHHRGNQAMMFSTVILGVLAMIQFSVYFYCAWSSKRL